MMQAVICDKNVYDELDYDAMVNKKKKAKAVGLNGKVNDWTDE